MKINCLGKEMMTMLLQKIGNRVYTIHGGYYKQETNTNPHIEFIFICPSSHGARLYLASFICLMLSPQKASTLTNSMLKSKPLLFLMVA